jgi:hypothetical protein
MPRGTREMNRVVTGALLCVLIPTLRLKKRLLVAFRTDRSNPFRFNLLLSETVIGWGGENGSFPDKGRQICRAL